MAGGNAFGILSGGECLWYSFRPIVQDANQTLITEHRTDCNLAPSAYFLKPKGCHFVLIQPFSNGRNTLTAGILPKNTFHNLQAIWANVILLGFKVVT